MSFNKSKSKSSTSYDPTIMGKINDYIGQAHDFANSYKPYDGNINAGVTPEMQKYFDFTGGVGDTGKGLLADSAAGARSALGFTPLSITAPTATAASAGPAKTYDPTAALGLLGTAGTATGVNRGDIRNVQVGNFDAAALAPYLNPATSEIVDKTLADNEHARQVASNYDNGKAAAAGAFGNSGFGVARAGTNDAFQRSAGTLAANVRGKAFDSAAGLLMQHLGLDLNGQEANQGADQFTAGKNADVSMFNTGQGNDFKKAGADLLSTAGMFNVGQGNTLANADAGRANDVAIANNDAALKAATSNQTAGIDAAGLQLKGAGLLGDLSNSQVDQATKIASTLGQAGTTAQNLSQSDLNRQYQVWQDNWNNMTEAQKLVAQAYGFLPDAKMTDSSSSGFGFTLPKFTGPGS